MTTDFYQFIRPKDHCHGRIGSLYNRATTLLSSGDKGGEIWSP
jgi:hypothetical protein